MSYVDPQKRPPTLASLHSSQLEIVQDSLSSIGVGLKVGQMFPPHLT